MKNDKNSGYRKFKKVLFVAGVVAAVAVLYAIVFILIPLIKEIHGF